MKKKFLACIALLSIAVVTSLNVYAVKQGVTTCTVTTKCYSGFGTEMGSVSCTGKKCERNNRSVTCDDVTTEC